MSCSLPLSYDEIKKQLTPEDKIGILFCGAGPMFCGYGGIPGARRLAEMLRKDGFNVIYYTACGMLCNKSLVKQVARNPVWKEVDTVISSGCISGYMNVKEVFSDKKVVKAFFGSTLGCALIEDMFTGKMRIGLVNPEDFEKLGIKEIPKEGIYFNEVAEIYAKKIKAGKYPPW